MSARAKNPEEYNWSVCFFQEIGCVLGAFLFGFAGWFFSGGGFILWVFFFWSFIFGGGFILLCSFLWNFIFGGGFILWFVFFLSFIFVVLLCVCVCVLSSY